MACRITCRTGTIELVAGSGIDITQDGNEYTISATSGGGETFLEGGTHITITGTGTELDPYIISADDQEISIEAGPGITITGTGTEVDPFVIGDPGEYANSNTSIGEDAGARGIAGLYNVVAGYHAAQNITTGTGNIVVGPLSGSILTDETLNVVVGISCQNNSVYNGATQSVAIGYNVIAATSSVAIGSGTDAGSNNADDAMGLDAVAIGTNARALSNSVSVGAYSSANREYNVTIGYGSVAGGASGDHAIAIGHEALASGATSTGIGRLVEATATNAVAIGNGAHASHTAAIVIGTGSSSATNQVILGGSSHAISVGNPASGAGFWKLGQLSGGVVEVAVDGSVTRFVTTEQSFNTQTGTSYTLALADVSKMVTLSNAGAITLTVPTNTTIAIPVGSRIDLAQLGAGQVTVAPADGTVTINSTPTLKLRAQYSGASLLKTATNTWLLVGDLATS